MNKISISENQAYNAIQSETEEDAISFWQKIFNREGDTCFPGNIENSIKVFRIGSDEGSLRVNRNGIVSPGILSPEKTIP